MRIGHYVKGLSLGGGIASYVKRLAAAQQAAGHEVCFLDQPAGPQSSAPAASLPVEVHPVDAPAELARQADHLSLDILHAHAWVPPPVVRQVATVRTLHGHWPYCPSGSQFFRRAQRACDRPYSTIGCLCGHLINRCGSARPLKLLENFQGTWAERRAMTKGAMPRTLVVSDFQRTQMLRSGFPSEMIHVLYLPAPDVGDAPFDEADPARQHADGTDGVGSIPHLLFAARLVPEKGPEPLLRALALVPQPWHLDIVGDGPSRARMMELACSLGLMSQGAVTVHGWLPESQVYPLMRAARAIVYPSQWHEPSGVVLMEAAAHGRAVVATRVGGIPEYAARLGNVLLCNPQDDHSMADAIQTILRDNDLAHRLGAAGRAAAADIASVPRHLRELDAHYIAAAASRDDAGAPVRTAGDRPGKISA